MLVDLVRITVLELQRREIEIQAEEEVGDDQDGTLREGSLNRVRPHPKVKSHRGAE